MKGTWPEWLRKWKGALGSCRYALLILACGAALLLLPVSGGAKTDDQERERQADSFDLEAFEEKLESALSQVEGAGKTRVVLTLSGGSRRILAQDLDRSGEGDNTATVVTVGRGSGTQEVVPLQTLAPNFRGALVVCPGGSDPQVKLKLTEAVSALTGLGADRISVCQGGP